MNKKHFIIIVCLGTILMAACAPSPQAIQTAMAQTQAAWTPTTTSTPTSTPTPLPPEVVTFYRLSIEYSTSSDWSQLDFKDSQYILAASVTSVNGHPTTSKIIITQDGLYRLALNRPVSALENEPTVSLTVDIDLAPAVIDNHFDLIQDKGDLNSTTLRLSYIDGDHTVLLKQVDQTAAHDDFEIDLTPLRGIKPSRAEIPVESTPPMVLAHYYPWYMPANDWMWWENPKWTDFPITRYDSSDPAAIALQIKQAQSAGINGFLCEWLGIVDLTVLRNNSNLQTLLSIAKGAGFSVAAVFDMAFTGPRPPSAQEVQSGLTYLINGYGNHPAYIRVNGKPLIILAGTDRLPLDTWRDIISNLRDKGLEATYLADKYELSYLDVFDGIHQFTTFSYNASVQLVATDPTQLFATLSQAVHYYPLLRSGASAKFWAAAIGPGFDNTPLVHELGASPQFVDRRGGDYYREQLQAAIDSSANWIFINSWNEFQENTQIEPSENYGDLYLRITRQFVDKWNSR